MDPTYVQNLHNLLAQTTQPDTVQIKAATAQLNRDYYKSPTCIPALFEIVATSPESTVRQLASVELRKRISQADAGLWIGVPQSVRQAIKQKIFEIIFQENTRIVRHSIARVISAIASVESGPAQWPELLPFIQNACTSAHAAHREVGSFILFTILDSVVEGFSQHTTSLFTLFKNLIQDPESAEVRVNALRSLGTLAQYIDADEKSDIKTFQALLPSMINVLGQCIQSGDEEGSRHGFDVFETMLILETPLLSEHVPDLVRCFLTWGANTDYPEETRIMALNSLNWTIKYKKSKVQREGLAKHILDGLLPIGAEEEPTDVGEDVPSRVALRIIDVLATSLPPSHVFPHLSHLIQQYMSSPDPHRRKSAMMALGVAVEGCSEFMRPHMNSVWAIIEAGFNDPEIIVKKATCVAVGCICEWLEDECIERHATLMPAILGLVNNPTTQAPACTALDSLLEILGTAIDQYLNPLMEQLSGMLDTSPLSIKAVVTGAIGSAAHASKERFLPYFQPTMVRLMRFLSLTGEGEEIELRGIAMDAIGTFAEAVGADAFRPFSEEMMKQAFVGIEMNSARLRECSFLFFGVMARVYGEDFAPFLPNAIPALIQSCKQLEVGEENTFEGFASGDSVSNAIKISEHEEMEEIDVTKSLEVNSAIAVEKEIAADTLGHLFVATKTRFLPYVEPCTVELIALLPHYYEGIRKAATSSLIEFIKTFYELSDPAEWTPGLNSGPPLHNNVRQLVDHVLPQLLDMYETEDDKTVASALCQDLADAITKIGPRLLEGRLDNICTMVVQILEQKALCQQDPDQSEQEESPEDQAEFESVLISSACDLVAALARALGPDFAQAFNTFFPLIAKYYKKKRSLSDRSTAIGCLGEIITGMKGGVTPFTEKLLELIFKAFGDEEADVRSNAAFASGVLVENTNVDLGPQYIHLLTGLRPFFVVADGAPAIHYNARDNAAGAVARMIIKNTDAVPIDQVIPVLLAALPLKHDYLENRPVFQCIFHLFRTRHTVMMAHIDHLIAVFQHVLDPNGADQLSDPIRAELIQLIVALHNEVPDKIQASGLSIFLPGQ